MLAYESLKKSNSEYGKIIVQPNEEDVFYHTKAEGWRFGTVIEIGSATVSIRDSVNGQLYNVRSRNVQLYNKSNDIRTLYQSVMESDVDVTINHNSSTSPGIPEVICFLRQRVFHATGDMWLGPRLHLSLRCRHLPHRTYSDDPSILWIGRKFDECFSEDKGVTGHLLRRPGSSNFVSIGAMESHVIQRVEEALLTSRNVCIALLGTTHSLGQFQTATDPIQSQSPASDTLSSCLTAISHLLYVDPLSDPKAEVSRRTIAACQLMSYVVAPTTPMLLQLHFDKLSASTTHFFCQTSLSSSSAPLHPVVAARIEINMYDPGALFFRHGAISGGEALPQSSLDTNVDAHILCIWLSFLEGLLEHPDTLGLNALSDREREHYSHLRETLQRKLGVLENSSTASPHLNFTLLEGLIRSAGIRTEALQSIWRVMKALARLWNADLVESEIVIEDVARCLDTPLMETAQDETLRDLLCQYSVKWEGKTGTVPLQESLQRLQFLFCTLHHYFIQMLLRHVNKVLDPNNLLLDPDGSEKSLEVTSSALVSVSLVTCFTFPDSIPVPTSPSQMNHSKSDRQEMSLDSGTQSTGITLHHLLFMEDLWQLYVQSFEMVAQVQESLELDIEDMYPDIEGFDNYTLLKLLRGQGGILNFLQDASISSSRPTAEQVTQELLKKYLKHPRLHVSECTDRSITLNHLLGSVRYDTSGLLAPFRAYMGLPTRAAGRILHFLQSSRLDAIASVMNSSANETQLGTNPKSPDPTPPKGTDSAVQDKLNQDESGMVGNHRRFPTWFEIWTAGRKRFVQLFRDHHQEGARISWFVRFLGSGALTGTVSKSSEVGNNTIEKVDNTTKRNVDEPSVKFDGCFVEQYLKVLNVESIFAAARKTGGLILLFPHGHSEEGALKQKYRHILTKVLGNSSDLVARNEIPTLLRHIPTLTSRKHFYIYELNEQPGSCTVAMHPRVLSVLDSAERLQIITSWKVVQAFARFAYSFQIRIARATRPMSTQPSDMAISIKHMTGMRDHALQMQLGMKLMQLVAHEYTERAHITREERTYVIALETEREEIQRTYIQHRIVEGIQNEYSSMYSHTMPLDHSVAQAPDFHTMSRLRDRIDAHGERLDAMVTRRMQQEGVAGERMIRSFAGKQRVFQQHFENRQRAREAERRLEEKQKRIEEANRRRREELEKKRYEQWLISERDKQRRARQAMVEKMWQEEQQEAVRLEQIELQVCRRIESELETHLRHEREKNRIKVQMELERQQQRHEEVEKRRTLRKLQQEKEQKRYEIKLEDQRKRQAHMAWHIENEERKLKETVQERRQRALHKYERKLLAQERMVLTPRLYQVSKQVFETMMSTRVAGVSGDQANSMTPSTGFQNTSERNQQAEPYSSMQCTRLQRSTTPSPSARRVSTPRRTDSKFSSFTMQGGKISSEKLVSPRLMEGIIRSSKNAQQIQKSMLLSLSPLRTPSVSI